MSVPPDSARLIRRLRVGLVLLAMLVGVALVAVIAVVLYWNTYLLDDRGHDPFHGESNHIIKPQLRIAAS